MKITAVVALILTLALGVTLAGPQTQGLEASTPPELAAAYNALADAILGAKSAEAGLVLSILSATYRHAEALTGQALAKIEAGEDVQADLEKVAALVSQLGNEGDASVAAVRKRLIDGGHHHNAEGEAKGIYDPGFVIVTRSAKKNFLAAATEIGKMAGSPSAEALKEQWEKVSKEYHDLVPSHH